MSRYASAAGQAQPQYAQMRPSSAGSGDVFPPSGPMQLSLAPGGSAVAPAGVSSFSLGGPTRTVLRGAPISGAAPRLNSDPMDFGGSGRFGAIPLVVGAGGPAARQQQWADADSSAAAPASSAALSEAVRARNSRALGEQAQQAPLPPGSTQRELMARGLAESYDPTAAAPPLRLVPAPVQAQQQQQQQQEGAGGARPPLGAAATLARPPLAQSRPQQNGASVPLRRASEAAAATKSSEDPSLGSMAGGGGSRQSFDADSSLDAEPAVEDMDDDESAVAPSAEAVDPGPSAPASSSVKAAAGNSSSSSGSSGAPSSSAAGGAAAPAPRPALPLTPLALDDMRTFLTTPTPRSAGVVQCYILREKGSIIPFLGSQPTFSLFLKDGSRFLLAGQKRTMNKTSNYMVCMDKRDLARDSPAYLGKLRANFIGTEYQLFDDGESLEGARGSGSELRKELGVVNFAPNVIGTRGPRKMKVACPAVDEGSNAPAIFRQKDKDEDSMMAKFKAMHTQDMFLMINKPPKWNDSVGAYVLNFNGRVTMASVKNFQLVTPSDLETVVLQFGRVSKEEFSMDYQWPLSPLQAFCICISA